MSQIYLGDKIIASTEGSDIKYDENTSVNEKIDELNSNLGGYSFHSAPNVVCLVSDGTPYTDDNGNYVLADSETGANLLQDTETYTSNIVDGNFYRTEGADSVSPFKSATKISVAHLIIGRYANGDSVSTHASTNDTELFTTKSQESASSGYVTVNKSCHAKLFVIATQRGASAKTKVKLNGTEIFSGSAYTNGYKQDIDLVAGDKLTVTVEKPDTTYAAFGFYIICSE